MHGTDDVSTIMLKITARGLAPAVHRDLFTYWGRRKFEGRQHDWT